MGLYKECNVRAACNIILLDLALVLEINTKLSPKALNKILGADNKIPRCQRTVEMVVSWSGGEGPRQASESRLGC